VDDRPMLTFDLTASIMAAAGAQSREDRPLDGVDILGQIAKGQPPLPRTLFWRARRAERTWKAVREPDGLKYVSKQDGDEFEEHLYDVAHDPGETKDLLASRRDDAKRLKQELAEWEQDVKPKK